MAPVGQPLPDTYHTYAAIFTSLWTSMQWQHVMAQMAGKLTETKYAKVACLVSNNRPTLKPVMEVNLFLAVAHRAVYDAIDHDHCGGRNLHGSEPHPGDDHRVAIIPLGQPASQTVQPAL